MRRAIGRYTQTSRKALAGEMAEKVKSKLGFYVQFNTQGHIGTGPQHCLS